MSLHLNLTPRERARLFLAMSDALGVPDDPQTQRDRARAEYVAAITERDPSDLFATLAVADDIAGETEGHDYATSAKEVAEAYKISEGRARHALRLAGWVHVRGDRWESEPGARTIWVPDPEKIDLLSELFE